MPDLFRGKPFDLAAFPPRTEQGKQDLQNFFKGTGDFSVRLPELIEIAESLQKEGYEKIGTLGFCWGMSLFAFGCTMHCF